MSKKPIKPKPDETSPELMQALKTLMKPKVENPLARSVNQQAEAAAKCVDLILRVEIHDDAGVILRNAQDERLCSIYLDGDGCLRFQFRNSIALHPLAANSFSVEGA